MYSINKKIPEFISHFEHYHTNNGLILSQKKKINPIEINGLQKPVFY